MMATVEPREHGTRRVRIEQHMWPIRERQPAIDP
jgi:hypothetical protein